jgi:homogentisate 1,2-dioxygenase
LHCINISYTHIHAIISSIFLFFARAISQEKGGKLVFVILCGRFLTSEPALQQISYYHDNNGWNNDDKYVLGSHFLSPLINDFSFFKG